MKKRTAALLAAILLVFAVSATSCTARIKQDFFVVVFDVGQSDCTLICADGAFALIDTGTAEEWLTVLEGLSHYGVKQLDYLILTHPHEDHIGNASTVMEELTVSCLLMPQAYTEEYVLTLTLGTALARGVEWRVVGEACTLALGTATLDVLPSPDATGSTLNNSSLVVRLCHGEARALFMGDAEEEEETLLLAAFGESYFDCQLLKVGHHGSATSTSEAFLAAADPQLGAVSCGAYNSYGFPHRTVLSRLEECGTAVYRTDLDGDLVFYGDDKTMWYQGQKR